MVLSPVASENCINPFQDDKILDWSNLKLIAGDILKKNI